MMGIKQVMVRRFDPTLVFRLIQEERATAMSLVPTMANALLNAPDIAQFDLSSLKEIHVGGAAASPELIGRLEKAFHCAAMGGYGLTETCPVATFGAPEGHRRVCGRSRPLSHQAMAGWPIPGVEIRVVDREYERCAARYANHRRSGDPRR